MEKTQGAPEAVGSASGRLSQAAQLQQATLVL